MPEYKCEHCNYTTTIKHSYNSHINRKNKCVKKESTPITENIESKDNIMPIETQTIHNDKLIYNCLLCKQKYKSQKTYDTHLIKSSKHLNLLKSTEHPPSTNNTDNTHNTHNMNNNINNNINTNTDNADNINNNTSSYFSKYDDDDDIDKEIDDEIERETQAELDKINKRLEYINNDEDIRNKLHTIKTKVCDMVQHYKNNNNTIYESKEEEEIADIAAGKKILSTIILRALAKFVEKESYNS